MTKGGSGKSKTLGRLIFGERRKAHRSASRHRSSARNNGGDGTEPILSTTTAPAVAPINNNPINIQDWAVWRIQLNEHMSNAMSDQRCDFKPIRHFLHSNSFFQRHSRDSSNGRLNAVQLLFSIPRAIVRPEILDEFRGIYNKAHLNEVIQTVVNEDKKVRSNSDDRTTTSVNSMSDLQPPVMDKTINQFTPKGLPSDVTSFLRINEQMTQGESIQPRSIRRSFMAPDHIHATLQKTVKDGNVLEKIKAFEMQAAAAQAVLSGKSGRIDHRVPPISSSYPTALHYRSSPAIVHPIQQTISPMPVLIQKEAITRPSRDRFIPRAQQHAADVQSIPIAGHKSRKGAHVLEPAHGDIILKRRTPSHKTTNEEDYSITAMSSVAMTASQSHHRNPHHYYHHRASASRSRHRKEPMYEKRASSKNENSSHKHQQKSKQSAITTPHKPTSRRHWLKGRKETFSETLGLGDKLPEQQKSVTKSIKTKASKGKSIGQEKAQVKKMPVVVDKEKLLSDNNRVYGVPNPHGHEQQTIEILSTKTEEKQENEINRDSSNIMNALVPMKKESIHQLKESDTMIPMIIRRRSSKSSHQQKLSSTDGAILEKIHDDHRLSRPSLDHSQRAEPMEWKGNDERNEDDKIDDDVFLEELPSKPMATVVRHQSTVNLAQKDMRRFQQQSLAGIRRHASQYSTSEFTLDQRYLYEKDNPPAIDTNAIKIKPPPITIITRKNKINQDNPIAYEGGTDAEQAQVFTHNNYILKKSRPQPAADTTSAANGGHGQNNNNPKQMSKQILHAIMNSMNNHPEQTTAIVSVAMASSVNDDFFDNGPLTNPEETFTNITTLASK